MSVAERKFNDIHGEKSTLSFTVHYSVKCNSKKGPSMEELHVNDPFILSSPRMYERENLFNLP